MTQTTEEKTGIYHAICGMKQTLQEMKDHESMTPEDIRRMYEVLDGLVFIVGTIDAKIKESEEEVRRHIREITSVDGY